MSLISKEKMTAFNCFCLMMVVLLNIFICDQTYAQIPQKYLESAANNNPLLKSEFNIYKSELEKVARAGSLPDPQVNMGFFLTPMERFMGNQVASISIMQMFPWFGTLGAAKNEATEMAKGSFQNFNEIKSKLFYDVKITYFDLYLLDKEIYVIKENLKTLTSIESLALTRYTAAGNPTTSKNVKGDFANKPSSGSRNDASGMAGMDNTTDDSNNASSQGSMKEMSSGMGSGSGSMVDVLKIQIEQKQLEYDYEKLLDSKSYMRQKFYQLTGISSSDSIEFPDSLVLSPVPIPLEEMADSLKSNNPMLQMLAAEEKAYVAMGRMNKKMGLPMFGVGLQYEIFNPRQSMGHSDMVSDMNGKNMLMPMASITIPIWRKKYTGAIRQASFLQKATVEKMNDSEQKIFLSYEELLKEYRATKRDFLLTEEQSKLAQQSLNIMITEYASGKGNFEDLIRMQQQLLSIELSKESSLRDNHLVVAGLERLLGR